MVVLLASCQGQTGEAAAVLTDTQRTEIEAAVRRVVEDMYAGARDIDFERASRHMSEQEGLCVWGTTIFSCQEIMDNFRQAWSPDNEQRLERQEMDGQVIRVMALSPTMAVVAATTEENRAYLPTGEVSRASFASFFVYVLENGEWKSHSGQQSSWPIEDDGSN
jgi:hypothetical protein